MVRTFSKKGEIKLFCINCGAQLNDGSKFCTYCGAAQPVSTIAENTPNAANAPKQDFYQPYQPDHSYKPQPVKKAGKGKIALLIILLVILVGTGIGLAMFAATGGFDEEPTLVSDGQVEEKDYDSAIDKHEAILENDPQNAEAYIADGKEKKAIRTLEEALEIIENKNDRKEIEDHLAELLQETVAAPAVTASDPDVSAPSAELFDISTVAGDWCCEEVYFGNELREIPINLVIDNDTLTLTSAEDIISIAPEQYTEYGFTLNYLDHSFDFAYNDDLDTLHMLIVDAELTTTYYASFRRGQTDIYDTSGDTDKVLNIWCYNDEFKLLFEEYCIDYADDVQIEWHIIPAYDGQYQQQLDLALLNGDNLAADEQVDLFIIEPDYSHKYVDSPYTMPIYDIGLTEDNTAQMYPYTIQIGTDRHGILKAVSWQATPGVFAYRRSIAKEVLGTDDPDEVQAHVADWASFTLTAEQMKTMGYSMLSGENDAQRVFMQNRSESWVNDNFELVFDDETIIWLAQTRMFADNGYDNDHKLWTVEWINDMSADGNVFGYFVPTWMVNWVMPINAIGTDGDWAICNGPDAYNWGSAYLCAAHDTDNAEIIRDIMYRLTCNEETMYQIATDPDSLDYVNNMAAMARAAEDSQTQANSSVDRILFPCIMKMRSLLTFQTPLSMTLTLTTCLPPASNRILTMR